MNKINPLFEAMSSIDDNIVINAKKARKRSTVAIIFAAAAAAFAFVGFTAAIRNEALFNGKSVFDYNLIIQQMTIPEKEALTALGAVDTQKGEYTFEWNTLPSTLWDTFGITPLMNGNFTEEKCDTIIWVSRTNGKPSYADIHYDITDKKRQISVNIGLHCLLDENASLRSDHIGEVENIETITLNDGSKALVYDKYLGGYEKNKAYAQFSYNGMAYDISAWTDKQGMMYILSDLGVL